MIIKEDSPEISAQLRERQQRLGLAENTVSKPPLKKMSRRGFLRATAAGIGTGIGGYFGSQLLFPQPSEAFQAVTNPTEQPTPTPEPTATPESIPSPERRKPGTPGYGFHLRLDADSNSPHNLEVFKANIDVMAQVNRFAPVNKLTTARLALRPWQTASFDGIEPHWNEATLDTFYEGLSYAQQKHIDVIATTAIPEFAHGWSDEDYLNFVESYYEGLVSAGGLHGLIRALQVENETNVHAYRYINGDTYGTQPELTDEYFDNLRQVIERAGTGAKKSDENILITTSFSYAFRPNDLENAIRMFTALKDTLDIITLHFYPQTNPANIEAIPEIIEAISQATGLPIAIGELGLPVQQADVDTQAQVLTDSIYTIRQISENVDDLIIYELQDAEDSADPGVSSFGLMTSDGQGKASFAPVLNALTGEIPTPTQTPEPTSTIAPTAQV